MKNPGQDLSHVKNEKLIIKIIESDKTQGKDYRGENLRNSDFSKKDFSKSSFAGSNLSGCNLRSCDLNNVDFTNTNLEGALLKGADMTGAKRGDYQILDYATITHRDNNYYAFLCQGKNGKVVLINEPNTPEYEFMMGKASHYGNLLYNLLNMA